MVRENYSLSGRHKDVAKLVLKGLNNKQISEKLGISTGNVKNHVARLIQSTGTHNRMDAAKKAKADGKLD